MAQTHLLLNHFHFVKQCPKCSYPEPSELNLIYAHQISGLSTQFRNVLTMTLVLVSLKICTYDFNMFL